MSKELFSRPILETKDFGMIREIRDPLYGYVYLNQFEDRIIEASEFQRLDRIFQMPTAKFVYPSGTHTRKTHSFGAMYLAHKALLHILYYQHNGFNRICPLFYKPVVKRVIKAKVDFLDQPTNTWWDQREPAVIMECLRLAALLHDIGHAPFSHLFEAVCEELYEETNDKYFRFNHEEMSCKIIEEKLVDKFKDPINVNDVIQILSQGAESHIPLFLHEIIDGPYDCDKLDYLLRDSYHTGTREYGSIDYERIIDGFRVKGLKLVISKSVIGALMNSFDALQSMYTNVYFHKTSRIFDFMISDALKLVPSFIKEIISDINKFLEYDDHNFIEEIKHRANSKFNSNRGDNFGKAWEILKNVIDRRKTYKLVFSHLITLKILRLEEGRKRLEDFRKEISSHEKFADLSPIIDFQATVRPVGISIERIGKWLMQDNIFDEDDENEPLKNLEDISRAYFRSLSNYKILFYVFVKRDLPQNLEYKVNELKEEASKTIEEIEKEEEKLG